MSPRIQIRAERPDDRAAIRELVGVAFEGMPYAAGDEAGLVDALRAAGALSVSLVAELEGELVGQIAFSPARPADGAQGWYALGPVAVLPAQQRSGIGSALVRAGLAAIVERGASGCILTGNPEYYARFGFRVSPEHAPANEPAEFFMVKLLGDRLPSGPISFREEFHGA